MKKSSFKIISTSTEEVVFKKNDLFISKNENINLKLDSNIEVIFLENNRARVVLEFNIFDEKNLDTVPFFIKVKESGIFEWKEDTNFETLINLLHIIAPALLLSYIRSIISQLVAFSGYPSLVIPFIDFSTKD